MKTEVTIQNWVMGTAPEVLDDIHEEEINIAILDRNVAQLSLESNQLIDQNIEFRSSGEIDKILDDVTNSKRLHDCFQIKQDMEKLLLLFQKVSIATSFRLLLATIQDNMCTKFHSDINDLRMLCTYSGQGTLWLTEDNINLAALDPKRINESIAIDTARIQQVKTGAVAILKGAVYPKQGTKAVLHRSPMISESSEKRLLLRIDTNDRSNF